MMFALPTRVMTASTWETLFWAQWNAAKAKRGAAKAPNVDDTLAPRVSNAEAIALVRGWRAMAVMMGGWSLWYQFAAIAYGWTVNRDTLVITASQAAKLYPIDASAELWLAIQRIALALEGREDPSMQLDAHAFANPIIQGEVRRALREDGAQANLDAAWVIGFGGCKDPKTGKPRAPKCKCVPTKVTGVLKCTCEKCDPVIIEDPWTDTNRRLNKAALTFAGMLLAIWLVFRDEPRPPRQRRN